METPEAAAGRAHDPVAAPVPAAPGSRRRAAWAALAMAAALLAFFSPALLGPRQFAFGDTGRMHLPVKRYLAEEMRAGRFPEWNPYGGLGYPLVAGAVDAVQHPFNALLVLLPFQAGFKAWVLLSYLLAALGAFRWARELGRSEAASAAAGLGFALSGYLVGSSANLSYLTTSAALPWIFACAHAFLARGGPGRLAALGAASALCAAGGDPQAWGLAVLALPAYAVALGGPAGRPRALLRGLAAAGACLVAAAPFVLPVAAWMPHSSRGEPLEAVDHQRWNLHPFRLLELAVPRLLATDLSAADSRVFETYAGNAWTTDPWVLSIYAGVGVLLLAAAGAARSRAAAALLLAAGLGAWMALGPNAGFGQLARHLPVTSGFRYWDKMVVWPALLLPAAAAFGFDRVASGRPDAGRLARAAGVAAAAFLALGGALALFPGRWVSLLQRGPDRLAAAEVLVSNLRAGLVESGLACALLAAALLALAARPLGRAGAAALLGAVLADLFAGNAGAWVLSPPEVADPRAPLAERLAAEPGLQRVATPILLGTRPEPGLRPFESTWRWGARTLAPPWNVAQRVGNLEAYTGMVPARAWRHRRRAAAPAQVPAAGLWGVGWVVVPLSVDLLAPTGLDAPRAEAEDPAIPAFLVPIPHRPRAYLAARVVPAGRREAMEFALDPRSPGSDRTALEGAAPPEAAAADAAAGASEAGEARIARDEPSLVEVETRSDRRALLVLNDAYAAGWTARVDGRPAEILPANYLARGVWVEAGRHRVEFAYRTPLLREGWLLCGAGALALAAWGLRRRPPAAGPGGSAEVPRQPPPSPGGPLRGE